MRRRGIARNLSRLLPVLAFAAFSSLLFSGCEIFDGPQNTFAPKGDVAQLQRRDFLIVMWPALVIMIGVLAACVVIPVMYRRRKGDPGLPKQVHGNTALELTWTVLPVILLAVIAVPTVAGIQDLGREPSADALEVKVTGQRFSWLFEYPELQVDGASLLADPNELRIPAGREIALRLESIDVNHSFWVPKLAGKTDAIQGHPNHMWIKADEPGEYAGQCAEFCGLQHSDMHFKVVVLSQADFDAWVPQQGAREVAPAAESARANGD